MRSATATPSTPFSRNNLPAVSSTRLRFAAASALLMRIAALPPARVLDNDDAYHHSLMTVIIIMALDRAGRKARPQEAPCSPASSPSASPAGTSITDGW